VYEELKKCLEERRRFTDNLIDISQKEMVERSLLNYNGILPEKT